jgi:hypothetical protein
MLFVNVMYNANLNFERFLRSVTRRKFGRTRLSKTLGPQCHGPWRLTTLAQDFRSLEHLNEDEAVEGATTHKTNKDSRLIISWIAGFGVGMGQFVLPLLNAVTARLLLE